jgi:hypothetical protein
MHHSVDGGQSEMKRLAILTIGAILVLSAGCAHKITFDSPPEYAVSTGKQGIKVIAVIDRATLEHEVKIRSFMTGIAHSWNAQPGDMLRQVADIELPQMFASYKMSEVHRELPGALTLVLTVPSYTFEDFRASVTVQATAYGEGKRNLLQRTYSAEGDTQGAKMFWGGAFAMKSAIRQSSFDAFKQVFAQMRPDLVKAAEMIQRNGDKDERP